MSQSTTKQKRCLLIEDREDDALLVRKRFGQLVGFDLEWVRDGEEAVQFLRPGSPSEEQAFPDVILLDLKLPRMDGFEFLEWQNGSTTGRQIPVMVLSCLTHPEQMRRSYDLGASSYLTKPINWTHFDHELKRLASGSFPPSAQLRRSDRAEPREGRVTCTMMFKDGKKLVVTAAAPNAEQEVTYQYAGDISCLLPFAEKGTLGFLCWYIEGMAANLDAEFNIHVDAGA